MTRVYYRNADAAVIMFDLTNRKTFENAAMWKRDLDSKCLLPDGSPIPCLLLANKVRRNIIFMFRQFSALIFGNDCSQFSGKKGNFLKNFPLLRIVLFPDKNPAL